MYDIVLGISMIKSVRPYFRKAVLGTLDAHDFLFINTITVFILVLFYFIYLYCFKQDIVVKTMKNYKNLSIIQILCIILLSGLTVVSTVLLMEFDKNYNTPLINSLYLKIASVITMLVVGIFLFEEKYDYMQILGFALIIVGIYLFVNKNLD
jgi:drug/metabolite transporter (DMT)-like permease